MELIVEPLPLISLDIWLVVESTWASHLIILPLPFIFTSVLIVECALTVPFSINFVPLIPTAEFEIFLNQLRFTRIWLTFKFLWLFFLDRQGEMLLNNFLLLVHILLKSWGFGRLNLIKLLIFDLINIIDDNGWRFCHRGCVRHLIEHFLLLRSDIHGYRAIGSICEDRSRRRRRNMIVRNWSISWWSNVEINLVFRRRYQFISSLSYCHRTDHFWLTNLSKSLRRRHKIDSCDWVYSFGNHTRLLTLLNLLYWLELLSLVLLYLLSEIGLSILLKLRLGLGLSIGCSYFAGVDAYLLIRLTFHNTFDRWYFCTSSERLHWCILLKSSTFDRNELLVLKYFT